MSERSEWQARIGVGERQVRYGVHAGASRDIPVYREDNGELGGKHTHHWDGRVDATIMAPTLNYSVRTGQVN